MNNQELKIKELVRQEVAKQMNFAQRKLGDTPTDNLQLVPRKYVNLNGAVASRPVSSLATVGQKYFATDTNIPMVYSNGGWRNGVGSIVAQIN